MSFTTFNTTDSGSTIKDALNTNFGLAAPLASPIFTGTPSLPTGTTAVTQSANNNSTKVATTAYVDAATASAIPPTIITAAATTLAMTTTAGQKVVVWAKGTAEITSGSGSMTVTLLYNGVAKDSVTIETNINQYSPSFSLMYTETPGAGTQNITITASGGVSTSIATPVIIALIFPA